MFELEYPNKEAIPSEVRHLFIEKDGVYKVLASGELKTTADTNRLQESLRKERNDHKETRDKFSAIADLEPSEILSKLDLIEELEAKVAAGGQPDDAKIDALVESRIKAKTAPLIRELEATRKEKQELDSKVSNYAAAEKRRTIHDHIRKAAKSEHIRDTAVEDALIIGERVFDVDESGNVVTKDGVGVTPGVEPTVWLSEIKTSRPHWWPESQGAGARGGNGGSGFGNNPFSKDNWNITEQGKLIRENPARAAQMATAAGTTVGGEKPLK